MRVVMNAFFAAAAALGLSIQNPMSKYDAGKPSDENMATLIQPQSKRRSLHQSAEIINAAQATSLLKQTDVIEQRGRGDAVIEDLHEDTAQRRVRVDPSGNDGRGGNGEETEHAVPEMVDRQIGNHPFQI